MMFPKSRVLSTVVTLAGVNSTLRDFGSILHDWQYNNAVQRFQLNPSGANEWMSVASTLNFVHYRRNAQIRMDVQVFDYQAHHSQRLNLLFEISMLNPTSSNNMHYIATLAFNRAL